MRPRPWFAAKAAWGCERGLERFVAAGKAEQPRRTYQHKKLLVAIETAKNDVLVVERMLWSELERGFDLLAFKMMSA